MLAVLWIETGRKAGASPILVDVHIGSLVVTERKVAERTAPRSVLVKPVEGKVYFNLIEPHDRVLEQLPSADTPVRFGYDRTGCELRGSADVAGDFRLLCRPHLVEVGSEVVLDTRQKQVHNSIDIKWAVLGLAAVIAIALYPIVSKRRSWWWW